MQCERACRGLVICDYVGKDRFFKGLLGGIRTFLTIRADESMRNKRRRSGGRLDDVMSDLSAFRTAVLIVQCRESRAAKARKGGVDAFGETSLQSEAALCQTKKKVV